MMKVLLFNFLLFSLTQHVIGQVSGRLTTVSGQPIPFGNVLVLNNNDSSLVKGGLTNGMGSFQIENIRQGVFFIRISAVGYQTWDSPVFELNEDQKLKDFETMVMKDDIRQLGEVVVTARKPPFQQQPDGIIVNVESSLLTKGSSALEVLERSPGVVVNHRDNSIALNGKAGVMVMLNGKLMRMPVDQVVSLLNGMSADNIEKIELLTNPSSRYDAEGNAGLINIILKKSKKEGTNGSVSLTGGWGWGEKGSGSINLARNTNKTGLYGSYTFSHDRTYSELFITSTQFMPVLGGNLDVLFMDTTKLVRNNHDATLGLDIRLNSKTTVGASINYNSSNSSSGTFTNAGYTVLPDSLLQFNGRVNELNHWRNLVPSIYLEKNIREGEKISLDVDYLYFKNDNPSEVLSSFVNKDGIPAGNNDSLFSPRQRGAANTLIRVGVAKMDYSKQLSKKLKMEAGIKGAYTNASSLSGIESLVNGAWTRRSETDNEIIMKERTGAAYASVNAQITPSANLVIGARYEYSSTNMDNPKTKERLIERKLGMLFPSIFFSRKLNDKSELQFSYTKRISRPSYNDLASYVRYSDPTAVYTGNPFLKPTVTNNIKLGYTYDGYSFSLLLSRDTDPIARYQLSQGPAANLLYISPQNLSYQNNISFQTNLPWKVNDWWSMNYGFVGGLRQFRLEHTLEPVKKSYFGYSLNFSQTFRLPKSFSVELSGWYNSLYYNGSVRMNGFGVLNTGIKKELKNNGGSFQLAASDLFSNMRFNVYYGTITQEAFSIKSHVVVNTESRKFPIIKLTYSRPFGSGTMKRKQDASSGDEIDRIRKD